MGSYLNKALILYKKYGIKYLIKSCIKKILKYDIKQYNKLCEKKKLSNKELELQRTTDFCYSPIISIVVPLYKTPAIFLREMIESIINQTYQNWELCLSDGSGKDSPIKEVLKEYKEKDRRIKVVYTGEQLKISDNTNKALEIATGDFIAFVDHDDLLTPDALFECIKVINEIPTTQLIYSDEDKITMDGKKYFQPHFKPDYNKDLLNSTNYFCHFFVVDKKIVDITGGLDAKYDGAQDYDFVLRCTEISQNIYHIPKVLYHWRAHMDSTAENPESKMYAFEAGVNALKAHYSRIGIDNVEVTQTKCLGVYRTHYLIDKEPYVSIIIPNKDHIDDLKKCLRSIENTDYRNYEIIIIENNSNKETTFEFYNILKKEEKIKVVYWEGEFNYSAINNMGVKYAKGEYFLFLNNDTEMIDSQCIHELVGFCMRSDVGAVGARLYYEDHSIQHAGVIIGLGGVAGHIFLNTPDDNVGYFARIISQQNYSAVTAACMLVKKEVFEEVGGFDEELKVAFNDVDLCLKMRSRGYLIVYNPYSELYHFESKSRGSDLSPGKANRLKKETELFEKKWENILRIGDPYYNKNLTLDSFECGLRGV